MPKNFDNKWDAMAILPSLGRGERITIGGRDAQVVSVGGGKSFRYMDDDYGQDMHRGHDGDAYSNTASGYARASTADVGNISADILDY